MDPPSLVGEEWLAHVSSPHKSSVPTSPASALPLAAAAALAATASAAAANLASMSNGSSTNAYPPSPTGQAAPAAPTTERFGGAGSGCRTPTRQISLTAFGVAEDSDCSGATYPSKEQRISTGSRSGGASVVVDSYPLQGSSGSSAPRTAKQKRLIRMYDNEKYADCTIRVGPIGQCHAFYANRTLLARCSEVFGVMLFEQQMQEERNAEVHIPDCSESAFRELLRCAHDMEPDVDEANFVEIFHLARKYDVEELFDAVGDWMLEAAASPLLALKAVDAAQASGVTPQSLKRGGSSSSCAGPVSNEEALEHMLDGCLRTVLLYPEVILETDGLHGLSLATMLLLVQQDGLSLCEEQLWWALLKWGQEVSVEDRTASLCELLPHLRFTVMSSEFFVDHVVPSGILQPTEVVDLLSARTTGRPARMFPQAHVQRTGWQEDDDNSDIDEASQFSISRLPSENITGVLRSGAVTPMSAAIDLSQLSIDSSGQRSGASASIALGGVGESRSASKRKSRVHSSAAAPPPRAGVNVKSRGSLR